MTGPLARRRGVRLGLAGALLLGFAALAALATAGREDTPTSLPARADAEKPLLMLLTSLPLVFGEGFGLDGGSPALTALEARYRVEPISVTDARSLDRGKLLLMAHPLAQPGEYLVALDAWVRSGGRLLLLADPALDWPSERPLGDPLRPPPMFADTGLLGRWGLVLTSPDERGREERRLGGHDVTTVSPGVLSGRCAIGADGLVARCRVGRGRVTVIADADFLNVAALDGAGTGNLAALVAELDALER